MNADVPKPLPTRDEFAATILATASTVQNKATALDYYKLAAEVLGFIGKNAVPTQTGPAPLRVMEVPAFASVEDADRFIAAQQAGLLARARAGSVEPGPLPDSRH